MFNKLRHSRAGFTLVEMILAMAILGIMSTMTLLIYFNISETSRRLQISRELSETARQITEKISQEVRANGVYEKEVNASDNWNDNYSSQYMDPNGSNALNIANIDTTGQEILKSQILYWKANDPTNLTLWITPCTDMEKQDLNTHCGLYIWENGNAYNLVDSFRSEESRKRVKISDLKFYVSGGDHDMKKVTLKMTLQLMARDGVPASLIGNTKMEIQTTFSERPYKIN